MAASRLITFPQRYRCGLIEATTVEYRAQRLADFRSDIAAASLKQIQRVALNDEIRISAAISLRPH